MGGLHRPEEHWRQARLGGLPDHVKFWFELIPDLVMGRGHLAESGEAFHLALAAAEG